MGLRLRSDMLLERMDGEDRVLLRRRPGGGSDGLAFPLHPLQAMVLALFDGTRTRDDVIGRVGGALGRSTAEVAPFVQTVQSRFRQFLRETAPEQAAPLVDWDPVAFGTAAAAREMPGLREAAPRALLWVVTEFCDKRCRYCYKDARFIGNSQALDLALPLARIAALAREAEEIGVHTLVLSGGEPFLRPDLVEVIRLFVERGVRVIPITKSRITGDRMKALAATGLESLHVSLDSHRSEVVDLLTGIPGSFDQMIDTVTAAAEHGLPVVLRSTLTSHNVRDLQGLVELARRLGVREILADTYGASCGRHDESLRVSPEDFAGLRTAVGEIRDRVPDVRLQLKIETIPEPRTGRGCVEGLRGLTFLPDGRATKCEHWRGGDLIYGDLRRESILEVWNSPALERLNSAPRASYAGSICERCKKFDLCNEQRGRCVESALLRSGTPFAPDVYCPIHAYGKQVPWRKLS
jgi:radical SAM protein with 4Fe4S-binding SPASM domain